jgi:hypothetical protein
VVTSERQAGTVDLMEAAVSIYREWECDLDYNGGSAANEIRVHELVGRILGLGQRPEVRAEVISKEVPEILVQPVNLRRLSLEALGGE